MDKFLQQFKDNLENQAAPEFEEQDWADMQVRLEKHHQDSSKPINYWAWAAVALLLLIVGSNGLILQRLNKANEKISHLEFTIDTLTQTKIIYQRDTIYQYLEQGIDPQYNVAEASSNEQIVSNHSPIAQERTLAQFRPSNFYPRSLFQENIPPVQLFPSSIGLQNAAINNATIPILPEQREILKTEAKQTLIHSRLNPVELKNISSMTATSALPTLPKQSAIVVKDKKSIQQILYPMRPKGIEVGTSYGLGRSLAAHHRNQEITHWGINAQTKFSDPIRLWMAADYEALEYESTKMGAAYGIPEIVPSSDNLEFDEANVSQHLLSISTGLQYRFRVAKKWQPFIGIGYGLSKFNSNIIKYRFEEPSVTNQIVGEIETVIYENTSNLSFGIFNSGILYQLNDKFSFQLGGEYRYRIKNDNNQLPNILSGKLGAHFSF